MYSEKATVVLKLNPASRSLFNHPLSVSPQTNEAEI